MPDTMTKHDKFKLGNVLNVKGKKIDAFTTVFSTTFKSE